MTSPAGHKGQFIRRKDMHQERRVNACCFGGRKSLVSVSICRDQPIAFHNDPLPGKFGPIVADPAHLTASIPRGDKSEVSFLLQLIGEPQDLLLFRRGQPANAVENNLFKAHKSPIQIIMNWHRPGGGHFTATIDISSSLGKWPDLVFALSVIGGSGETVVRVGGAFSGKYLP